MRAHLRHPGFRLLFAGLVTSTAGDWLMALVLGIWVEHRWILSVMGIGLLVVGVTRYAAVP